MKKNNPKKKTAKPERTTTKTKTKTLYEMKSTPEKPPTPRKAERPRRTMGDEVEELQAKVSQLTEENDQLRARVAQLETSAGDAPPSGVWKRGKLPGEKLIKTNVETGKFQVIDRAEWDALA